MQPRPTHRELAGIGFVVMAVACFASMDTLVGWISHFVPVLMALWFRYLFQALATTAFFWPSQRARLFATHHLRQHVLRGLLLLAVSAFAFFSLKFVPVGEFTAIIMTVPLIITFYASSRMGERVSWRRWTLVLGGFLGVLIIVRPGHEGFTWAWLLPMGCVVTYTAFQLITARMTRSETPATMHVYTGWTGALACTAVLPWVWTAIPHWQHWAWMALVGGLGTLGHFLLILAYARAPAATLTPYLYVQIGFAMLGGWVVNGHIPDLAAFAGMTLIGICGALAAWLAVHEKRSAMR